VVEDDIQYCCCFDHFLFLPCSALIISLYGLEIQPSQMSSPLNIMLPLTFGLQTHAVKFGPAHEGVQPPWARLGRTATGAAVGFARTASIRLRGAQVRSRRALACRVLETGPLVSSRPPIDRPTRTVPRRNGGGGVGAGRRGRAEQPGGRPGYQRRRRGKQAVSPPYISLPP
jgi:hypothetical protein